MISSTESKSAATSVFKKRDRIIGPSTCQLKKLIRTRFFHEVGIQERGSCTHTKGVSRHEKGDGIKSWRAVAQTLSAPFAVYPKLAVTIQNSWQKPVLVVTCPTLFVLTREISTKRAYGANNEILFLEMRDGLCSFGHGVFVKYRMGWCWRFWSLCSTCHAGRPVGGSIKPTTWSLSSTGIRTSLQICNCIPSNSYSYLDNGETTPTSWHGTGNLH